MGARDLPPLADDLDAASLAAAIARTLPAYERTGDTARAGAARRLLDLLAATPDAKQRREVLATAFRTLKVRDPLHLTAYFEPEIAASLEAGEAFRHAIYARPPDLVTVAPRDLDAECGCRTLAGRVEDGALVPYFSRAEIDAGALADEGLELAWAADPVDLLMLHVQGSGLLRLPDGRRVGVRFAATNGRPYRSVARALVERGLVPPGQADWARIRAAIASRPEEEQEALLATNPRYVFFRIAAGEVTGSLGVPLTPGRSIAADPRLVPPGTLAYLATPSVRRFVVVQDTGGAITGAHADLFLGAGAAAGAAAERTNERGALYLFLPR